ncbi:MAG: argininosuccinate lyase [Nitrospirae bacterium]|nr:argininosuccinate lyase [Candidatus Troglogloeales bacterium]
MAKTTENKLWGERFSEATDPRVDQFTESLSEDYRLFRHDIAGSIAHANALSRGGILTAIETKKIICGLKEVEKELEVGSVEFLTSDEDIHTYIERRLTEKIGPLGGKLHTGRSRNDQVALDLKLYLREKITEILHQTVLLQKGLVVQAEKQIDIYLPGYTHLQRAQPVLLSHHLLAYYEMLERDRTRFADCQKRLNQMPLGAGALAGNSFQLSRKVVADELRFKALTANSIDTVSDRDFIAEFLSASSILMVHLSRWAEEWILWASSEFGFITLSDRFCTGSSIMPQKKNPDVLELVRGKSGRVFGALVNILVITKGLPFSYNRDLQEDKRPLFDTVETVLESLTLMTLLLSEVQFNRMKMEAAASDSLLLATDLADYLAQKGLPFREAHGIVGKIVQEAIANQKPLHKWPITEFQKRSRIFQNDLLNVLTPRAAIEKRGGVGGTATASVKAAIQRIKKQW